MRTIILIYVLFARGSSRRLFQHPVRPFIRFTANDGAPVGSIITDTDGSVTLHVSVQAAPWVPRGAHGRLRCGRSLSPVSSTKTIVRLCLWAFFYLGPAHLLPAPNRFLVPFQGAPDGALAPPSQFPEECAPDVDVRIRTPHLRLIRSATRQLVHSPVSYPRASGPRFSPCTIRRRSAALSCGWRPARPAFRRISRPPAANSRAQRWTDWRWTPTRRATSDSLQPRSNQRARPHPSSLQRSKVSFHSG